MIDFATRFLYRKRVYVLFAAGKKNQKSTRSVPSRQGRTFCEAERIVAEGGKKCCGSNMTPPSGGKNRRQGRQKDLIGLVQSFGLGALIRGLQNLEAPFGKFLILFVRSRHCGELNQGLQNLETPGKGVRVGTFCGVQKVPQKHAEGCDPLDSRGRFKALLEIILEKLPTARAETGFSHKTVAKRL